MFAYVSESAIYQIARLWFAPSHQIRNLLGGQSFQMQPHRRAPVVGQSRHRGFDFGDELPPLGLSIRRAVRIGHQHVRGDVFFFRVMVCNNLFFAFSFDATNGIQRSRCRDPIKVRRRIVDFSLTFQRAPQTQPRVLLNFVVLQAEVFGADTNDRLAQKPTLFLQQSIEPSFKRGDHHSFQAGKK